MQTSSPRTALVVQNCPFVQEKDGFEKKYKIVEKKKEKLLAGIKVIRIFAAMKGVF